MACLRQPLLQSRSFADVVTFQVLCEHHTKLLASPLFLCRNNISCSSSTKEAHRTPRKEILSLSADTYLRKNPTTKPTRLPPATV